MNDTESQTKPQNEIQGLTFFPVPEISDSDMAFGLDENMYFPRDNRPKVPKEYKNMVQNLFFKGGKLPKFREGVDPALAKRYLQACLSSFAPAHESKISTAGYALWNWIEGDDD